MDIEGPIAVIVERFQNDGFKVYEDTVYDMPVTIATNEEFRLSWLATKMIHFAIIGRSDQVTRSTVDKFSALSWEYAKKNYRGIPRGFQKGFVSYSTLVTENVSEDAKQWVAQTPRKHYAAFEMPVIIDSFNREIYYCKKSPLWGRIYYKSFRQLIEKYFQI